MSSIASAEVLSSKAWSRGDGCEALPGPGLACGAARYRRGLLGVRDPPTTPSGAGPVSSRSPCGQAKSRGLTASDAYGGARGSAVAGPFTAGDAQPARIGRWRAACDEFHIVDGAPTRATLHMSHFLDDVPQSGAYVAERIVCSSLGCLRRADRPIPDPSPPPERIRPTGPSRPIGIGSSPRVRLGDGVRARTTKAGFEATQRSP